MEGDGTVHMDGRSGWLRGLGIGVVIWTVAAGSGPAGQAAENAAQVTRVCLPARTAGPIVLDGVLDEPSWSAAIEISGFALSGKEALAPEQTVMRVLWDASQLYVGVVCLEPSMSSLRAAVRQRDGPFWEDDSVEFFLDPGHTHEDYFQFAAAAGGAVYDNQSGNALWNSGWRATVGRGADRWTVEGALPLADLKVTPPTPGTVWGFNLCRERHAGGRLELHNWADVNRVFNSCNRFGHLAFVGPEWTPSPERVAELVRPAAGELALLSVANGFWTARQGADASFTAYAADVAAHVGDTPARLAELAALVTAATPLPQRQRLEQLRTSLAALQPLSAHGTAVRAEAWAGALGILCGLSADVEALYWQMKLADLNRTMP